MRKKIPYTPAESCALALLGEPQGSDPNAPPPRPVFLLADTGTRYLPDTQPFTATPLDKHLHTLMQQCEYIPDGERGYLRYHARFDTRGITPLPPSQLSQLLPILSPPYASGFSRLCTGNYHVALPLPVEEEALDNPTPAIRNVIADWNALHPESIPARIEHCAETPYLMMRPPNFQTLYNSWADAIVRRIVHSESRPNEFELLPITHKIPPTIAMDLRPIFAPTDAQNNAMVLMGCLPASIPPLDQAQSFVAGRYGKEASSRLPAVHRAWQSAIENDSACHIPWKAMYRFCQSVRNARPGKPNLLDPNAPYEALLERCRARDFTIAWPLRGEVSHMQPLIDRLNTHFDITTPFKIELLSTGIPEQSVMLMTPQSLNQLYAAWKTVPHPPIGTIDHEGTIVAFPSVGKDSQL